MRRSYPEEIPQVVVDALDRLTDEEYSRITAVWDANGFDGIMLSDGKGWFYKPVEKLEVFDILDEQFRAELRSMNAVAPRMFVI